jgi:hypothetical protein
MFIIYGTLALENNDSYYIVFFLLDKKISTKSELILNRDRHKILSSHNI